MIKAGEIGVHEMLHQSRSEDTKYMKQQLANVRLNLLPDSEKIIGRQISGRVVDYGCGSGYLSVWLAQNRQIDFAVAVEITQNAVEKLIPNMIEMSGVDADKVRPSLGDFSKQFETAPFDYAFCMGSLHHALNLRAALDGIFENLKPGGVLISQEPVSDDLVDNSVFQKKYSATEEIPGYGEIRNDERSDCFYRRCEYLTALHHSGFSIQTFEKIDWTKYEKPKKKRKFQWLFPATDTSVDTKKPAPHLIIAQKPLNPQSPPHRWT
ncbi:class I SAM-dependent methyltransferase [uncultured Roseibium sp.]|uniref:class I SAM-dependent methyltransferase n=1 Tax=uncultured Roseibium sp. TaxID=1936171 RepID=UPI002624087E|nr:class I SAM-dependent methyltransferase [uncultured Roseibium sp.]